MLNSYHSKSYLNGDLRDVRMPLPGKNGMEALEFHPLGNDRRTLCMDFPGRKLKGFPQEGRYPLSCWRRGNRFFLENHQF